MSPDRRRDDRHGQCPPPCENLGLIQGLGVDGCCIFMERPPLPTSALLLDGTIFPADDPTCFRVRVPGLTVGY